MSSHGFRQVSDSNALRAQSGENEPGPVSSGVERGLHMADVASSNLAPGTTFPVADLKYIQTVRTKGREYHYFRAPGVPRVKLDPASDHFPELYEELLSEAEEYSEARH